VNIFNADRVGSSHTQLFPVVHLRGAASSQQKGRHQLGDLIVVNSIAIAIPLAPLIVIAEEVLRLAISGVGLNIVEQTPELRSRKLIDVGDLKVHWELNLIAGAVELGQLLNVRFIGFGDQNGVAGELIDDGANLFQHVVNLRQVIRVLVFDVAIAVSVGAGQVGIIMQVGVFEQTRDGINAEA
jgi:hypothetical protein